MTDFWCAWILWCVLGLINIVVLTVLQIQKPASAQTPSLASSSTGPMDVWTMLGWIATAITLWPIILYGYLSAGEQM